MKQGVDTWFPWGGGRLCARTIDLQYVTLARTQASAKHYTGCPKKTERWIFSTLHSKSGMHLPQKRMIPKSLNLVQYFLFYVHFWKCSHFQISLDFCDVWAKDLGATSIPYGKPVDPCQQKIQLAQWARARMKPKRAKPVFLIQTDFAAESSGALLIVSFVSFSL